MIQINMPYFYVEFLGSKKRSVVQMSFFREYRRVKVSINDVHQVFYSPIKAETPQSLWAKGKKIISYPKTSRMNIRGFYPAKVLAISSAKSFQTRKKRKKARVKPSSAAITAQVDISPSPDSLEEGHSKISFLSEAQGPYDLALSMNNELSMTLDDASHWVNSNFTESLPSSSDANRSTSRSNQGTLERRAQCTSTSNLWACNKSGNDGEAEDPNQEEYINYSQKDEVDVESDIGNESGGDF